MIKREDHFCLPSQRKTYYFQKASHILLSRVPLFATPWTVAYQAPLSMGFQAIVTWSGLPFPSPDILLLLLLSHFSHIRLCATPQTAANQAQTAVPWDSPGKNTGVGCHFLLQCMQVKSESEVAQSCPTTSDPMDRSPAGSSINGILQARALEWGAIALSSKSLGIVISKEDGVYTFSVPWRMIYSFL